MQHPFLQQTWPVLPRCEASSVSHRVSNANANPPRSIVLGSVDGRFAAAFKKLATLHAKNQFACCIATGNLFAGEGGDSDDELAQLLAGQIPVPVTTYFTVGTRPFPPRVAALLEEAAAADTSGDADGNEICPNLHYLGKHSITKTADGLRIVALGGRLVADDDAADDGVVRAGPSPDACLPFHSAADAAALLQQVQHAHKASSSLSSSSGIASPYGIDILLTAVWPRGVWRGSQVPPLAGLGDGDASRIVPLSDDGVADLVAGLRPRYHLTAAPDTGPDAADAADAAETFFYEREPFFHPERPDGTHSLAIDVTRFLALASWGNAVKAKALYAFVLSQQDTAAAAATATVVPAGSTASPFLGRYAEDKKSRKRQRGALDPDPYTRFAQTDGNGHRGDHRRRGRGGRRARAASPPPGPDRCFFCLSNPNLPTHMVASIGNDAYLATAKGPLPLSATFEDQGLKGGPAGGDQKPFPGHMIIVPLSHAPTISAAAMDVEVGGAAAATFREMARFRRALQAMVGTTTDGQLGAVTWEISRQRNVHVHWQLVPVPAALAAGGLVEAAFRVEAANQKLGAWEEAEEAVPAEEQETYQEIPGDYFRIWIWGETPTAKTHKSLVMRLDPDARFDLQFGRRVVAKLLGLEATRTVWQECAQTEAEETADVEAFRAAFAPWDFALEE